MAKWSMLLGAGAIVFGLALVVGLRLLPEPHSETDYLVVGSIATLLCLGVLFAVMITTWVKSADVFFKKRPKGRAEAAPETELPPESE